MSAGGALKGKPGRSKRRAPRSEAQFYTLDAKGKVVPEHSGERWRAWYATAPNRVLKHDNLAGGVIVSTLFIGANHTMDDGPPVLWETMILRGPHCGYCERHPTRRVALQGHRAAVAMAREALAPRTEA